MHFLNELLSIVQGNALNVFEKVFVGKRYTTNKLTNTALCILTCQFLLNELAVLGDCIFPLGDFDLIGFN